MPLRDPLYHPLFLGRRAAPETPPFESFPPSGRKAWKGEPANGLAAQQAFHHRARLNGAARTGSYTKEMERA